MARKYNPNKFGDIVRKAVDTAIERLVTRLTDIILKEINLQFEEQERSEKIIITKLAHNKYHLTVDGTIDVRKLCLVIIKGMMKDV